MQDSFSVGKHFSAHPNRCWLEKRLKSLPRKTRLSGTRGGVNAMELKSMLGGKRVKAPPGLLKNYPELKKFAGPDYGAGEPNLSRGREKNLPLGHGASRASSSSTLV